MKKLVITGPESSGKTSLAQQLSSQLDLPLVTEFARDYLNNHNGSYVEGDLVAIAKGQLSLMDSFSNPLLKEWMICDTDLVNIAVWQEYVFERPNAEIDALLNTTLGQHYFLCYPDLNWSEDPFRENPDPQERLAIFELHLEKIQEHNIPYTVIKGQNEDRLNLALSSLPF